MPTFAWKCKCGEITDVVRAIKDIDVPPDACQNCGHMDLVRTIVIDPKAKNFQLTEKFGGHDREYLKTRSRN